MCIHESNGFLLSEDLTKTNSSEAGNRYKSMTPGRSIRSLKMAGRQVDPLLFSEVKSFLANVPSRYRNYFIVAFFTGMRSSELTGLKPCHLDFDRREITLSFKSDQRIIHMSSLVVHALQDELDQSEVESAFVFHNTKGKSLNYLNVARRIWYPTLEKAGISKRHQHQTRHTTATIWLIARENPAWVSQQMGYMNTDRLSSNYPGHMSALVHKGGTATEQLLLTLFRKEQ